MKRFFYIMPFLVLALFLGAAGIVLYRGDDPSIITSPVNEVPAPYLEGVRGPAVVNFFASWCPPCRQEHPYIVQLSKDLPTYGVAYMDHKENTKSYLAAREDPYQKVFHDEEGQMGVDWGLVGIPVTVVLDADNMIRYRHERPINPQIIKTQIEPVITQIKAEQAKTSHTPKGGAK